MEIKFYKVSKNMVGQFNHKDYDEKLVKILDMNYIPRKGETICGYDGIWSVVDVCYDYDEDDKIYNIDITVIDKD